MLRLSSSLQGKKISWWVIEYLHSWCACSKDNVREVNMEKFSPFSIEHCDISLTDYSDIYELFLLKIQLQLGSV